jgi:predicted phosphoadenosine phosphosulfate sulfurtransferase
MKYLILNDSTIQALSFSNTKVDTDKANKVTIAHHREFPKLINPPKNNRKYWD